MKLKLTKFLIISALMALSGCTTYQRSASSPKPYLVGSAAYEITDVKAGLSREIAGGKSNGVNVTVYPVTEPLIRAKTNEKAFKQKWSDAKLNAEIKKKIKLVANQPIFKIDIRATNDYKPMDILSWHVTLIDSNDKRQRLMFAKGLKSSFKTVNMNYSPGTKYVSGYAYTTTTYHHSYDAILVGTSKIDYAKPFRIEFEPRYQKNLKKFELVWQEPTKEVPKKRSRTNDFS